MSGLLIQEAHHQALQEAAATATLKQLFNEDPQLRVRIVIHSSNCRTQQEVLRGRIRVAGGTRTKFFRDDLPGGRVATVLVEHKDIISVSRLLPHPPPLCAAAHKGDADAVSRLLAAAASAASGSSPAHTPLHATASRAVANLVNGHDDNFGGGWTALHWAAAGGTEAHLDIVLELLSFVFTPTNSSGHPPSSSSSPGQQQQQQQQQQHPAALGGGGRGGGGATSLNSVHEAEIHGAEAAAVVVEVNALTDDLRTPLHLAAQRGHADIVMALVSSATTPVFVDATDKFGETPLHKAAEQGHEDVVALLLQAGADPRRTNARTQKTPQQLAVENGHEMCRAMLVQHQMPPPEALSLDGLHLAGSV